MYDGAAEISYRVSWSSICYFSLLVNLWWHISTNYLKGVSIIVAVSFQYALNYSGDQTLFLLGSLVY